MGYINLDGQSLKTMLLGGASVLKSNASMVNDLNVFPVPDGDTGLNMTKTLEGGVDKILSCDDTSASVIVDKFAHGALFGARGNSGVILSQIIKGLSIGLEGLKTFGVTEIANAFKIGVETAYHAVERPVEGTILTVVREATEFACHETHETDGVDVFFKNHLEQAKKTLFKTKEMLPVLKEADVVDSGGAGYVCFVDGMYRALIGEEIAVTEDFIKNDTSKTDYSLFTKDSVLTYGYCTEFILRLQTSKVDIDTFDEKVIIDFLKSIDGDSIVCYKDEDIVKVHVHTLNPGAVLSHCQKYGEYLNLKIENMNLQHSETHQEKATFKRNAIVSVVNGEGLISLFKELGADAIINGGQTGNPSSEDFVKAFDSLNCENIFVLPNNSNIYLAATQAGKLYKKANVIVIKTKSIQQGYVALSVFDSEATNIETLTSDIYATIEGVVNLETTYAVRDAVINDINIKKGHFMTFINGRLACTDVDEITSTLKAIALVEDVEDKELLTVFVGKDVSSQEKQRLIDELEENYPDLTLTVFDGGQNVYNFLISVE